VLAFCPNARFRRRFSLATPRVARQHHDACHDSAQADEFLAEILSEAYVTEAEAMEAFDILRDQVRPSVPSVYMQLNSFQAIASASIGCFHTSLQLYDAHPLIFAMN
jgi:hypothetical protein